MIKAAILWANGFKGSRANSQNVVYIKLPQTVDVSNIILMSWIKHCHKPLQNHLNFSHQPC